MKRNIRDIKQILINKGALNFLPDKKFLEVVFKFRMGYKLNLKDPKTFNEKLQWLKLYDRNPQYTNMVDKAEAKRYVKNIIGEEYIIPTLGIYNKFDEINFANLPKQFVIKCTHDSGGLFICKNKDEIDFSAVKKKINKSLKRNYYKIRREWPYKNVKPRIIVEKYMVDESGVELKDYKFFCFNGKPMIMFVATDRGIDTRFDFYDMNFNHLDFTNGHPNSDKSIKKPIGFEKMKKLAEVLSKGIPHVRVDFYDINGKIYFGEFTFYHWSGFMPFVPERYDRILGDMLELPNEKREEK